ncbi:hypothetical protein L1049_019700 [Liquidambar formosana]|uniref:BLISTER n=1 Tax=Liquidambar formosana TaxID=63359 RepID=A0AAP0S691_LIQFO
MASAQVLPNASRKQEHLEAGKRRLEEFRKKKAAERAKKAASTNQPHVTDVIQYEKQPLETERVRQTDSDGVGTSDGAVGVIIEPSGAVFNINDNKAIEFVQSSEQGSSNDTHASPLFSMNEYSAFSADAVHIPAKDQDFKRNDALGTLRPQEVRDIDSSSSQSSYSGIEEAKSKQNNSSWKDFTVTNSGTSHVLFMNVSSENTGSTPPQNKSGYASMLASGRTSSLFEESALGDGQNTHGKHEFKDHMISNSDLGERKLGGSVGHLFSAHSEPWLTSESPSTSFNFDVRSSLDNIPTYSPISETNTRRSRPSFLDSLNMPRVSSLSPFPLNELENAGLFTSNSSKVHDTGALGSSASQKSHTDIKTVEPFPMLRPPNMCSPFEHSMNSLVSGSNGGDPLRESAYQNGMERKHEYHSLKQQEDFSALEQHIEDLTQEKFSLQRALEASRALAESLAAENSSLTESYNQQGSVVNQLKSDMEKLQEEIKAQLVELESINIEYGNAQLECSAADERAKLLASEVIGLEEKALRLRSSELKLERQLENSQAEISSYKKKMSSLEREHQDLQLSIDALQEEKKLLQSKIRKASASGKSIDVSRSPTSKKDVSTCTEDLVHGDNTDSARDNSNQEMHDTASLLPSDASSFTLLPENGQFNREISSASIPPDQMRMIQNIDGLISELALEKEELMQALAAESSQSSKLKDLNKELSQKLEAQTQRLELLIAQSMANESIPARQPDSRAMHDSPAYADEGDEVVERVLGWIMKLFPGGPSRRRTSKLL